MISFKLFAGTDIGLRDNNEDNFTVCPNLSDGKWIVPDNLEGAIPLDKKGCLMIVADGMGGMNAGEVASDIAIKTVQQMFSAAALPADVTEKPDAIKAYLKKVIIQADYQTKQHCKEDPSTEGMGSTIIIAWLIGDIVYVAWLGDSRAYSYIPDKGITRLSKDHSYVQQLVDAKMLTEEEAMIHPQSNVITRSLGDTTQKAKPDVICHNVQKGEVILLCSDGLCGVCSDTEIAEIIKSHSNDLPYCKETLTNAALKAGGSDNITVALLQVVNKVTDSSSGYNDEKSTWRNHNKIWIMLCCLAVSIIGVIWMICDNSDDRKKWSVEKIEIEVSANLLNYEDTISYNVTISPSEACQEYTLYYDEKILAIDSVSSSISMKKNKSGKSNIIVISNSDSLKRDSVELVLQKKPIAIVQDKTQNVEDKVKINFSISPSGPLEAGKCYDFSVSITPDLVAKGNYKITCSDSSIKTDTVNHQISIPKDLKNTGKCVFTITPKLMPSKAQSFEFELKTPDITPSLQGGKRTTLSPSTKE